MAEKEKNQDAATAHSRPDVTLTEMQWWDIKGAVHR